jgi:dihydropyrimidine dehydrogenase (NAD+) subunit PreT
MQALIAGLVAGALILILSLVHLARRSARERASRAALDKAVADRRHLPVSLHPVIDPEICIGSLACLKSCPEGDILGVIDGKARLVQADRCIGHGRCAAECPVGAIQLVMGTAERGVDLPEVDEFFESSRPGVHVVGELGGMGLIKNAVTQGLQVSDRLAEVLAGATPEGMVDVAIIGAGPAGLSTAAGLRARGKSFRLVDQQTLGGTVSQYPRQKVVMTEPVQLPFVGRIGKSEISKEELLESWHRLVKKAQIQVQEGVKVESLGGADGAFEIRTDQGSFNARKVVLATGRRGSPRKLGVPGEASARVTYRLDDPEQYDGCRVLVVGGGDSAVEAAAQLADQSSAEVAISYRGEAFNRCREPNRVRIGRLSEQGKVACLFQTEVSAIEPDGVVLRRADGQQKKLLNDFVLVLAGGELPLQFLEKMGVGLRRYHGERLGTKRAGVASRAGLAKERTERSARRARNRGYLITGLLIVAWLCWNGRDYYLLDHAGRLQSPQHAMLRPSGLFGHWIGIVATFVMLGNFLYPLRKRVAAMRGLGNIRDWLDFHVFVGFSSPAVIAFHAAFQSNNQLATATAAALLVVVLTGIAGRFLYGLVPSEKGRALERAEVLAQLERAKDRLAPLVAEAEHRELLEGLLRYVGTPVERGTLLDFVRSAPLDALRLRRMLFRAHGSFGDRHHWHDVREIVLRIARLKTQARFFGGLKRLLGGWRLFHAVLAGFLVLAMTAHVAVSLYLGYLPWRQ